MKLPFISIIILNWNGKKHLKYCLASLKRTAYPADKLEVIVVDNNSSDGSTIFVKKFYPNVCLLELDRNYGFAGGNNRGAQIAKGEMLVFLNNDTEVTENWLIELVNIAKEDRQIGICGSKILFMEHRDMIQYAGGSLNILGGAVSTHVWREDKFIQVHSPMIVGYVCGACLLVKRDLFDLLGGFDEDYFMYSDENDLCWRCWLLGYKVVYVPRSIVYHLGEGGTKRESHKRRLYYKKGRKNVIPQGRIISDTRLYYANRNALFNLTKNLEVRNAIIGIIGSIIYFTYQTISLLRQREPKRLLFLCGALLSYLKSISSVWKKRQFIQENRMKSDKELFNEGLILDLRSSIALTLKRRLK